MSSSSASGQSRGLSSAPGSDEEEAHLLFGAARSGLSSASVYHSFGSVDDVDDDAEEHGIDGQQPRNRLLESSRSKRDGQILSREENGEQPFSRTTSLLLSVIAGSCVAMLLFANAGSFGSITGSSSIASLKKNKDKDTTTETETEDVEEDLSSSSTTSWTPSAQAAKPNIIFMLADDLGYNSMQYSATTDLTMTTPFLSKMAAEGIVLTNYYAQESCTPSRAALLTGRYPLRLGMQFNDVSSANAWALNDTEILLPELLRAEGYSTYMLGKWNLGHFSPRFLPTARGFDYFMGFLTGETYYWSKLCPQHTGISDLLYASESCYHGYDGDDRHDYSTFLYRDKAIKVIKNHDYSSPLFLYLSFQGVHDPYHDHVKYTSGIPKEYLPNTTYTAIHTSVVGRERRQLAMALALMDDAVQKVYKAVKQAGQSGNTIYIWASDNGGCVLTGGRNGDLRGSKGTLFEGGTKVDAFIYSPLLPSDVRGSDYSSVFHVTDWMPTILGMANISYSPESDHELDGYSHADNLLSTSPAEVRTYMLYNFYTNIQEQTYSGEMWNMWSTAPLAIRTSQYKLVHTYDNNSYSGWYAQDTKNDDDDSLLNSATCSQTDTLTGNYSFLLFDLVNDPNETTNLYDSDDETLEDVKTELYDLLIRYAKTSRLDVTTNYESTVATKVWVEHHDTIVPWAELDDDEAQNYPQYCKSTSLVSPSDNDDYSASQGWASGDDDVLLVGDDDDTELERNDDLVDTEPTFKPSRKPSPAPTFAPDYLPPPTAEPTPAPSGPTEEPTGLPPQNLPTIKPTASKLTAPPTKSLKTAPPTPEPSSTYSLVVMPTLGPSASVGNSQPTDAPVNPAPPTVSPTGALPTPIALTNPPTASPTGALPTPIALTNPPTVSPTGALPTPIVLTNAPTPVTLLNAPTLSPSASVPAPAPLVELTGVPTPTPPPVLEAPVVEQGVDVDADSVVADEGGKEEEEVEEEEVKVRRTLHPTMQPSANLSEATGKEASRSSSSSSSKKESMKKSKKENKKKSSGSKKSSSGK